MTSGVPEPNPHMPDNDFEQELESAIWSFEDIEAELNYKQARDTLQELIKNLDLTPSETKGLEAEINQLETMLENLERRVVQIAVFGMVGRGKSSLLNALLGKQCLKQARCTVSPKAVKRLAGALVKKWWEAIATSKLPSLVHLSRRWN
jgi:ribosome biogenesis GTPase A